MSNFYKPLMSTGKRLSEYEKGLITAYNDTLKSYAEIGRKINRSPDVVSKYLRDPENYEKKTYNWEAITLIR